MFAQSEGVNGVTGKQERGENSEDVCVVATGSNTVQGANPWWEAGRDLAAYWTSLCHTDHWPL